MKVQYRIVIYPKDVQILTGKSYRQSLRLLQRAKQHYGKSKQDLLSFEEFCRYYHLPYDFITKPINECESNGPLSYL